MILTISGTPGSGKSSIGKSLAKKLDCKFYSAGDVRGKYALEHGMTIDELNKQAEQDPTSDKLVDDYMKSLDSSKENMIIDARLGWLFLPSSIKIFVDADETERARRILRENRPDESYSSLAEAKQAIVERVRIDQSRYRKLYDVDPYNMKHYDLVLDTTNKTVDQAIGEVYRFVMFKTNQLNQQTN